MQSEFKTCLTEFLHDNSETVKAIFKFLFDLVRFSYFHSGIDFLISLFIHFDLDGKLCEKFINPAFNAEKAQILPTI